MDQSALHGTWRLISWKRRITATGEISDAMGPEPVGYIAYHPDGRMMAFVAHRHRARPAGATLTTSEKTSLFDSMLAYTASYSLEGNRVIHHVETAWNPNWERDLVRPVTIEGKRLVIDDARETDPVTGETVIYRLEFEKM